MIPIEKRKLLWQIPLLFICVILLFNYLIMPWYVSGDEVVVPKLVGLSKEEAEKRLDDINLELVIAGERNDENVPKGHVLYQKPEPMLKVKEGRRVYLYISSGKPVVKVPSLLGKSIRDAKFTLERVGLILGDTTLIESGKPRYTIIDQQYYEGSSVAAGTRINITLSAGQKTGLIPIPDLLGKTLSEAEAILLKSQLNIRRINYQPSFSLLPNTVIDQYPSKDNMATVGDSVDLFVTKNATTPDEVKETK